MINLPPNTGGKRFNKVNARKICVELTFLIFIKRNRPNKPIR